MFSNTDPDDPSLEEVVAESQGRLQRPGDDGVKITSFKQVMLRHGLLMFALSIVCILLPNAAPDFFSSLSRFFAKPFHYFLAFSYSF